MAKLKTVTISFGVVEVSFTPYQITVKLKGTSRVSYFDTWEKAAYEIKALLLHKKIVNINKADELIAAIEKSNAEFLRFSKMFGVKMRGILEECNMADDTNSNIAKGLASETAKSDEDEDMDFD